jgi:hypothetical protein
MSTRAAQLGGTFAIRRARLGGVIVELRIPLPPRPSDIDRDPEEHGSEPGDEDA